MDATPGRPLLQDSRPLCRYLAHNGRRYASTPTSGVVVRCRCHTCAKRTLGGDFPFRSASPTHTSMNRSSEPDAMGRRVVMLGEIVDQLPILEVVCSRCDRRRGFFTDRLVTQYGADMPLLELLRLLSADCPKRIAQCPHDACKAGFPTLEGIKR